MHLSIFGDTEITPSSETIVRDGRVTIISLFGDARVSVPRGTRVVTTSATIFGDCRVLTEDGDGPELRVAFFSLFGDLRVVEREGVALPPIEGRSAFPY